MTMKILSLTLAFLSILTFATFTEAKDSKGRKKIENKRIVSLFLFDKDANKILSEKGLIDSKGVVSSKCRIVMKWFDKVENTLIIKTEGGKHYQLGKILSCNIKKDQSLFLLEPLDPDKGFLIEAKPQASINMQTVDDKKLEKPAEMLDSDNIQDLLNEGLRNQKLKNYSKAIEYYKKALELKAEFPEAMINLGNSYFISGKYNEAIETYKQILEKDKTSHILIKIGTAYLMLRDYDRAIQSYKQALHIEPINTDAYFSLGLAHLLKGDKEGAFNNYLSLRKFDAKLAEDLFDLIYK